MSPEGTVKISLTKNCTHFIPCIGAAEHDPMDQQSLTKRDKSLHNPFTGS